MAEWLPIEYRGFHDIPRMVVVKWESALYLLDCPFDEEIDNFSPRFTVYLLPLDIESQLSEMSWESLPGIGERFGEIPVDIVEFDSSRRRAIKSSVFTQLKN
jgi:hypothetical protein